MTVKKSIPKQDQKVQDQAKTQDQAKDQTQIVVGQSQDQSQTQSISQGDDMKKSIQSQDQAKSEDQAKDQTQSQDQAKDQKKIVSVSAGLLAMLTSPKAKNIKDKEDKIKVEKKSFKSLNDQYFDYTALSLSFFGQVISLNDVKSKVAISQDFDDQIETLINRSSIGSIDKDTNFSGSIVFNGSQAVNLIDHQVYCFSKSYTDDKNDKTHQGIYSWQVQKFVKLVLINEAIKSKKSIKIDMPSVCPFISLSWSSFASALLSLGCPLMSIEKINTLKKSFDHDLIDHLNNEKLLLEIDLSFSSILSLGQPKQDQNQVKA